MATWNDVVTFCKENHHNCHECPIRGKCWEERRDKLGGGRNSKELEKDMIEALDSYMRKEQS